MASSIPVAVSNLKRLIWNTQKAWLSKNLVFMHSHKLLSVSEHIITSNLLLLKKPLSLQPFTLSLFLCLPLTESVSSSPLRSNVSPKTRETERARGGGREMPHLSGRKLVSTVGSLPNFPCRNFFDCEVSAIYKSKTIGKKENHK